MKKRYFLSGIFILLIVAVVLYNIKNPKLQESITYFPIDPNVTFKTAETSLKLVNKGTLIWKVDSTLDRKAYLRQDVGLLYSNGRLIGVLRDWQENTARMNQEKRIEINRSALFEAISFHYAELHEKGGQIFSSQSMSGIQLYVINPATAPISFRTPQNNEQNKWKQQIDERTERMLQYSRNKGVRHYSIDLNEYQAYPLNLFNDRAKKGLPGFTKAETDKIIGSLWEGIYKNYLLGIKKEDSTSVNPIGSTIPLILLSKNKTHLLVLSETGNNEPILLRQAIEDVD